MVQTTPRISGILKGAAFGATLAMLPFSIIFLLVATEVVKERDLGDGLGIILVVLQLLGCLIWSISLMACTSNAKRLNVSTGGIGLSSLGIILGFILQLIVVVAPDVMGGFNLGFAYDGFGRFMILLLLTMVVNLPLAIGTGMTGKKLPALRMAMTNYIILALFPLVMLILAKVLLSGYSSFRNLHIYLIITAAALVLCCILAVTAWWRASSDAAELETEYENGEGDFAPQPTFYVEPQYAPAQQQYQAPKQSPMMTPPPVPPTFQSAPQPSYHQPAQPAPQPSSGVTEAQKNLLMGMSDQELTNVVNNPALYANPAFVEEAKKTLTKRQAWEMIKDYTDEQLLSIVHDNIQGFSYEVLDAASMELFSREAPAFVNEIQALDNEELQGIVANPAAYYDGYVRAASAVLNARITPPVPPLPGE